jgi:opacity protein-like surface antigen
MKNRIIHSLIIGAALLAACASNISAAEAPKEDQAFFDQLITAIMQNDYDAFVANSTGSLKQMTQDQFSAAVQQLSPRLNSGYEAAYLGAVKKGTGHIALWRLTFKGVADEALASMFVKDGKPGAFTIK